uniref:Uncharacterized protein n=1 Tax=Anguilla anguilla TaxID=7936 RepID=A0A0E9VFI2_ANGAN
MCGKHSWIVQFSMCGYSPM